MRYGKLLDILWPVLKIELVVDGFKFPCSMFRPIPDTPVPGYGDCKRFGPVVCSEVDVGVSGLKDSERQRHVQWISCAELEAQSPLSESVVEHR